MLRKNIVMYVPPYPRIVVYVSSLTICLWQCIIHLQQIAKEVATALEMDSLCEP